MNIVEEVPLGAIGLDLLQLHHTLIPNVLALVDHLRNGGTVPPIHVQAYKPFYKLLDGYHRYVAYKLLGRETITVYYDPGENP